MEAGWGGRSWKRHIQRGEMTRFQRTLPGEQLRTLSQQVHVNNSGIQTLGALSHISHQGQT